MFITVSYNEFCKPNIGYKGVKLSYADDKSEIFFSGDFIKDWWYLTKFIVTINAESERIMMSSSVHDFLTDTQLYDSVYLNFGNNGEDCFLEYEYNHEDPKCEFFIPKGTKWSWKELKEYCTK
jgi:hypothetical protein